MSARHPRSPPPGPPPTATGAPPWPRRRTALAAALAVLCSAVLPGPAHAAGTDGVERARELAGSEPAAARRLIAELRSQSLRSGALAERLAVDEVECRLLSDENTQEARRVAEAGLAAARAASSAVSGPALLPLQRLRACHGGILLDLNDIAAGDAELEQVLAQTDTPELAAAHALALLERGLHRSRRGELTTGQDDLIAACRSLRSAGAPQDLQLCLWQLANHEKRVGDLDEAFNLFTELLADARRREARSDEGIALYSLGQVQQRRGQLEAALGCFREALAIETAKGNRSGMAYAESQLGSVLLQQGHPAEAHRHLQRSLVLFDPDQDPEPQTRAAIAAARAAVALGRPAEATEQLRSIEARVLKLGDDLLASDWNGAQVEAQEAQGHWREALQALRAQRRFDERLEAHRRSEQSERLRLAFNREKDARELQALQQLNAQGERLRQAQAFALALFVALLAVTGGTLLRKVRQARRLQTLALVDELTRLPNRRAVLDQLQRLAASARRDGTPLSLLMVDVDHFKRVNDTHGHGVGDEVLRQLARRLAEQVRPQDQLGRLGGEEFMVLLPATGEAQARSVAQRILRGVAAAPLSTAAGPLAMTVSIGCATAVPADDGTLEDPTALTERADAALYAAKTTGRNRTVAAESLAAETAASIAS